MLRRVVSHTLVSRVIIIAELVNGGGATVFDGGRVYGHPVTIGRRTCAAVRRRRRGRHGGVVTVLLFAVVVVQIVVVVRRMGRQRRGAVRRRRRRRRRHHWQFVVVLLRRVAVVRIIVAVTLAARRVHHRRHVRGLVRLRRRHRDIRVSDTALRRRTGRCGRWHGPDARATGNHVSAAADCRGITFVVIGQFTRRIEFPPENPVEPHGTATKGRSAEMIYYI